MFNKSFHRSVLRLLSLILAAIFILLPCACTRNTPTSTTTTPGSYGPRANSYDDPADSIYVSPNGNDSTATGAIDAPYRTINGALDNAQPGSTIVLRECTYKEGINVRVRVPNITIKFRKGEWAVIDLTSYEAGHGEDSGVYFDVGSSGGKLQAVEVIGGWYAVSLETKWDWGDPSDRAGASNIIIDDCKLHDSRYDVVKIKPNCNNVTIRYNEIYNSGKAFAGNTHNGEDNAEGIDNVNGDNMFVHHNYIHDICSNAIYAKGGATDVLIEYDFIEHAYGGGILVGFDTSPEFFDTGVNPQYYENIRGIARYNLIVEIGWEGIGLYGAKDAQIYNNTLVNVANGGQYHSAIYFGITFQDWEAYAGRPANINPSIHHNVVLQPSGIVRPMLEIRYANKLGGLSALSGNPTMSNNCYFIASKTAVFTDNRPGSTLGSGTLSDWQAHIGGDNGSLEVDPALDDDYMTTNPQCSGMGIGFREVEAPLQTPQTPTGTPTQSPSSTPSATPTSPTATAGQSTYNIADFHATSGHLALKKGETIAVGAKQYRVLVDSYSLEYWAQSSLESAITWWTEYLSGFVSDGVVAEI